MHKSMSETFGFDLPDKSKELTDKEYVNLVNRIRGNFLSYVSDIRFYINCNNIKFVFTR